ncbi:hypothetical protein Tco_1088834 [Tanacetum coccineum]
MTANIISPDSDTTWVDVVLRFTEPVGYEPTMLLNIIENLRILEIMECRNCQGMIMNFSRSSAVLGVTVGPVFLLGLQSLAIDAACAFRAEELISCWMAAKVMAGVSDVNVLLGGNLSTQDNA